MLSIKTPREVQLELAETMKAKRNWLNHSRGKAAELSGVPAPTIRRFEDTGEISLRQFLLLCGVYGNLGCLDNSFAKPKAKNIQELVGQQRRGESL